MKKVVKKDFMEENTPMFVTTINLALLLDAHFHTRLSISIYLLQCLRPFEGLVFILVHSANGIQLLGSGTPYL